MEYQGKTEQEWNDEIDAKSLDDFGVFTKVMDRVFPDAVYTINDRTADESHYELLNMVNKPAIDVLETELAELKTEEKNEIYNKFRDIERINDIQDRWNALGDLRGVMHEAGISESNPLALLKKIIKEDDQTTLSAMEAAKPAWDSKILLYNEEQEVSVKARDMEYGVKTIAYINLLNSKKPGVTIADINAILANASMQSAVAALQTGSLKTAKSLIQGMDISGTIFTEDDRIKVIERLDKRIGV